MATKNFGLWLDFSVPNWDTGAPTFDVATTAWHDQVKTTSILIDRAEHENMTGRALVETAAAGQWLFDVSIELTIDDGAKRRSWNNAVAAGQPVAYKFIEDRSAAPSEDNVAIFGAFLPSKGISGSTAFGEPIRRSFTFKPAGPEPYIKVAYGPTAGDEVYFGKP